jgi:sialidase-1
MLSDDHGSSWRIGGILDAGTSESAVVETAEAAVYINCRNQRDESLMPYRRARAWSHDGGETFSEFGREDALIEPSCEGSFVRFTKAARDDRNRVLFANPASTEGSRRRPFRAQEDDGSGELRRVSHLAGSQARSRRTLRLFGHGGRFRQDNLPAVRAQ